MVGRNLSLSHIWYLTEKSAGIHEGINILPLPDTEYEGWWNSNVISARFLEAGNGLYLDLDVFLLQRMLTF